MHCWTQWVPLHTLDSKHIKNLIWLSRTLANVMGEYFVNEIVQSCGKGYETEVTTMGYNYPLFFTVCSTAKVFDPILAGSEDEYHFKAHKVVKDCLETHFCRCLSKKERKAMLKADPIQTWLWGHNYTQSEWLPADILEGIDNNAQDGDLKKIQTAILNGAAPLCWLWSQLIEQWRKNQTWYQFHLCWTWSNALLSSWEG